MLLLSHQSSTFIYIFFRGWGTVCRISLICLVFDANTFVGDLVRSHSPSPQRTPQWASLLLFSFFLSSTSLCSILFIFPYNILISIYPYLYLSYISLFLSNYGCYQLFSFLLKQKKNK